MHDFGLLIDGCLVGGDMPGMPIVNPATEECIARCPRASMAQMEQAVVAANRSLPQWACLTLDRRREYIGELAESMQRNHDRLTTLLTLEQGKPVAEAIAEVDVAIASLDYFATLRLPTIRIEDSAARLTVTRALPLGVVAAITTWNYPVSLAIGKIAPALLAGNTVILKPAPTTPLTSLELGALASSIFPAGVVNVLADQHELGPLLSAHADIAAVSLTGSIAAGKRVMESAAATLKRITLELGGNDPAIVLRDADVASVAPRIFANAFSNAGQVCRAIKRLYVHDSVADAMIVALKELARTAVVGDGFSEGVQIGPIQNAAQLGKLRRLLDETRAHGGDVFGGEPLERSGYFMRPAIVTSVSDSAPVVADEQFGPVLPILTFCAEDEVIERVNRGAHGLGGSVWTADVEHGAALARRIIAGTVTVNQHMEVFGPAIPFAGAKQSGIGVEFGEDALAEFAQLQVVSIARGHA